MRICCRGAGILTAADYGASLSFPRAPWTEPKMGSLPNQHGEHSSAAPPGLILLSHHAHPALPGWATLGLRYAAPPALGWLFLGGLLSSRARLRFTSWERFCRRRTLN